MTKIVFDVGATSTRVARVEGVGLKDIWKAPTPPGKKEGLEALFNGIKQISPAEIEVIVGGIAGVVSEDGVVVRSPNLPGWDGCDLTGALKENIASAFVYNDALMAGLGEAVYGAGKNALVVAYLGLGTGIGGSRIVNKSVDVTGFEPGHHIVEASGLQSWEQKISGRILKEKYGRYPEEKLGEEVYKEYIHRIAVGVHNAILFWMPEVVVMGGSLVNGINAFNVSHIAEEVKKINSTLPSLPKICQSELGDNAGLHGAMAVILRTLK